MCRVSVFPILIFSTGGRNASSDEARKADVGAIIEDTLRAPPIVPAITKISSKGEKFRRSLNRLTMPPRLRLVAHATGYPVRAVPTGSGYTTP
jgi:hypothetical protein